MSRLFAFEECRKSSSRRRLYSLGSNLSLASVKSHKTSAGHSAASRWTSASETQARSMGISRISPTCAAMNFRQCSTKFAISRNSDEMRIETTLDASSGGGLFGEWIHCTSHSKMCTSQCTDMSMSSHASPPPR